MQKSKIVVKLIQPKKIPQLKMPRSLFGLRTLYARLHRRLKKMDVKVPSMTVYQLRRENNNDTRRVMSALRQGCRTYWRLIHAPLTVADAVPECTANNL